VLGVVSKLTSAILLLPAVISYTNLLKSASPHNVTSILLSAIGGIVLITWMAIVVISALLYNDNSLKPILPWGSKPFAMEITIILQKYLLSFLLLYKANLFQIIIHTLIIGIAIASFVSYIGYYGITNSYCKLFTLLNITICIWLSVCSIIKIIIGCSYYSLIPNVAAYPLLIYLLHIIKRQQESHIIKSCSLCISKSLKWFYLYFIHMMDNFVDRSISNKCSFLVGMILKHQNDCKDRKCPCSKIELINSSLNDSQKMSSAKSLFFEKSQSLDSMQHSQANSIIEDLESKKKSCDEGMITFFEYILKTVNKINPYSALPLIYSAYFHLYIKDSYYEALFELEKCNSKELSFFDQFCVYHTK
jgi:hypothetical protein